MLDLCVFLAKDFFTTIGKQVSQVIVNGLNTILDSITTFASDLFDKLKQAYQAVVIAVDAIVATISNFWTVHIQPIIDDVSSAVTAIINAFAAITAFINDLATSLFG